MNTCLGLDSAGVVAGAMACGAVVDVGDDDERFFRGVCADCGTVSDDGREDTASLPHMLLASVVLPPRSVSAEHEAVVFNEDLFEKCSLRKNKGTTSPHRSSRGMLGLNETKGMLGTPCCCMRRHSCCAA